MLNNYLRLIRWDKPIGTLLLLWPTWWGLWLAYAGHPPLTMLLVFSLGVFLTRAAGCAINDAADHKFDAQVTRTAERPVATGQISRMQAVIVSLSLAVLAFIVASLSLTPLTLLGSIPALILLLTYPLLKRFFWLPQLYLGIAFSFGIVMAFLQARAQVPLLAWLLFAANLCWVMAYDTIYALVDIDDDRRIGIQTSALTFGRIVVPMIMLAYFGFFSLLLRVGVMAQLNWPYYLGVVFAAGLSLRIYVMIKSRQRANCWQAFLSNNNLGLVIFVGMLVSYGIK